MLECGTRMAKMLLFHGQPRVLGYLLWLRLLQVFTDEMVGSEVVVMVPTQMQRVALPFVGNPACGVVEGWDAQATREI